MHLRSHWENAATSESSSPADIYGAEHLARLLGKLHAMLMETWLPQQTLTRSSCLVSLPELLAQTNMDQQSISRLREELSRFTLWLSARCEEYFVSEYENPSQEYIDKARSF